MQALVQRYYETVDSNDIVSLLDLFEDYAVYERPGYEPFVGRDALRMFYNGARVIESGRHTVSQAVIHPGSPTLMAVQGTFVGRLRDSQEVSVRFSDFFEEGRTGRIARRTTYFFAPLI